MAEFINEKVKVNLITPLVMYGNQMGDPEIRSTSIKGVLRWWLRAYIGSPVLSRNIEDILFGSTDRAAILKIRVLDNPKSVILVNRFPKKWQHNLFYFNYSISNRKAFEENCDFDIAFILPKTNEKNRIYLDYFFKTLQLFSIFGSLGARSRRGYGSVFLSYNGPNTKLQNALTPISTVNQLKQQITDIFSTFKKDETDLNYYNLANAEVYIVHRSNGDGFDTYEYALKEIIDKMKQSVRGRKDDSGYLNYIKPLLKEFIEKDQIKFIPDEITLESSAFGLPINYQSRSLKQETDFINSVFINLKNYGRVASPLLIKVLKLNGKFYPLITYFKNNLMKNGSVLDLNFSKKHLKNKTKTKYSGKSKLNISLGRDGIPTFIEEFLNQFEPIIKGENHAI